MKPNEINYSLKICLISALTFNIIFMLSGMKIPASKGRRLCLIRAFAF
jgi:hypothetical protein